jgi:hypothetical protein
MSIPSYLPYFVLTGTAAIVAAILYGLRRALTDADWPAQRRTRTFTAAATVLLGWLVLAVVLAGSGIYHVAQDELPTIQYGILVPILVGVALVWRSDTVRRLIEAVPQQWLVSVQIYRALGAIFLVLYASGDLPPLFAWPAGVGDIAIGLLAPVVGVAYARAPREAGSLVAAWNVFGILDLVVAVTTGFLAAPSLIQPFTVQPTSELMTVLPMALIPVYLVPLSIILHVASLAKLYRRAAAEHGRPLVAHAA